jgi:NADH dehydrogenase
VRVQIALGDLTDPPSFRNALRGVTTVVHLAASLRDQPRGSIEELNGIATWRMVEAASRAGVEHFVFASALGASRHSRSRFLRAKALAEEAVVSAGVRHSIVAPSLVYAPGDRYTTVLGRLALLPVVPYPGRSRAQAQPIWAEDVAECLQAVLAGSSVPGGRAELAGPETMAHHEVARAVLHGLGRDRPVLRVPGPLVSRTLKAGEVLMKSKVPVTWDEAELLQVPMVSRHGTAHAEALGVMPKRLAAVLA